MDNSCCRAAVPSSVCSSYPEGAVSAATPGYIRFGALPSYPYIHNEKWEGNAHCLHQCNFVAPRAFYVTALNVRVEKDDSFSVAIRSRVGNDVSRYLLFSTDSVEPEYLRLYENQKIPKNFCIELWTVDDRSLHISHPIWIYGSLKECFYAAPDRIECFDHVEIVPPGNGSDPRFTFDHRLPHISN
jgi:hypothetical protein